MHAQTTRRPKETILHKVYAVILIVVTIFFTAISYRTWVDVKDEKLTDLSHKASVLERYYELTFQQRELGLISVGQRMLDIRDADSTDKRTQVARAALKIYDEFLAIGLADTTGQLIVFTGEQDGQGLPNLVSSTDSRRSFMLTKEAQNLVIGEAYYFNKVNDWIIPIRVPIRNSAGKLLAVNTSAIRSAGMNENLQGFGYDPRYRIHYINAVFGTTQLYFPLTRNRYDSVLRKQANIYIEQNKIGEIDGNKAFEATNSFEGTRVMGIRTKTDQFDHYLVVSVDYEMIRSEFWNEFRVLLTIYVVLMIMIVFSYRYVIRKQSHYTKQLKAERDYSTTIVHDTPSLIIGISKEGKCTFINPAAERITGYNKDEIIGKNWWKICYPGEEFEQVREVFRNNPSGTVNDYEMTLTRKDGEKRTISWNSAFIYDRKGEVKEGIGFGNDVTDLKKTQQTLRQYTENLEQLVKERTIELESANQDLKVSNRKLRLQRKELERTLDNLKQTQDQLLQSEKMASLGMLSAGIGHEINNPLNFIKGGISGLTVHLKKHGSIDQKTYKFFDAVNEGVKRASEIVASLSHFSRQGSDMNEKCDIHDIIDNCLIMLQSRLKNKVEVVKNYTAMDAQISGNEGKLHQLFLNILSNAEQAIEQNGQICIETKIAKNKLHVNIKDNGHGICEEDLSNIHDPFFTTKAPGEGTGLGLSISHSIIEEHHGSIEVKSKLNNGSSFIVKLPLYH